MIHLLANANSHTRRANLRENRIMGIRNFNRNKTVGVARRVP
jgi:hypothetical protein